jgi:hypothetical protein
MASRVFKNKPCNPSLSGFDVLCITYKWPGSLIIEKGDLLGGIGTIKGAKKSIIKWLTDNGHTFREIDSDFASFLFVVDYPTGQLTKQQIMQPKLSPDLIVVGANVVISAEHAGVLQKMKPKSRHNLLQEMDNTLLFADNIHRFEIEDDVLKRVVFEYQIYFDGLTKHELFKGLNANHKTFLYLSNKIAEKVGKGHTTTSDASRMYG